MTDSQQSHRRKVLLGELFTPAEAEALSRFSFNLPYIAAIRANRRNLVDRAYTTAYGKGGNESDALRLVSKRIKSQYKQRYWDDEYSMIRKFRSDELLRGWEGSPPAKKVPRSKLSKGNVLEQKRRARARKKVKFTTTTGTVEFNPKTGRFEPRNA